MTRLLMIDGVDYNYRFKLQRVGIRTVESLLMSCQKPDDRKALAQRSRIPEQMLQKWANQADLTRVRGIGGEFAKLLEAVDVVSVPTLAQQQPQLLLQKMVTANAAKKAVRKIPTLQKVEYWVEQARQLPEMLQD